MESETMLTQREKSPLLETERKFELALLHHSGQRAQHSTNWAIPARNQWLKNWCSDNYPCQVPGIVGSVLWLVCLPSVYCDWVIQEFLSQYTCLNRAIVRIHFVFYWDVKQAQKKKKTKETISTVVKNEDDEQRRKELKPEKKENGGYQAHLHPIWRLEPAQQNTIFRLRIGHCGLSAHLKRIGISDTSLCECGQDY